MEKQFARYYFLFSIQLVCMVLQLFLVLFLPLFAFARFLFTFAINRCYCIRPINSITFLVDNIFRTEQRISLSVYILFIVYVFILINFSHRNQHIVLSCCRFAFFVYLFLLPLFQWNQEIPLSESEGEGGRCKNVVTQLQCNHLLTLQHESEQQQSKSKEKFFKLLKQSITTVSFA